MTSPSKVTITERVRMNAIAGIVFVLVGDALILFSFFSDNSGSMATTITGVCGAAAILFGMYYMLCYMNKRLTVSQDGVDYSNWMGRKVHYSWDQVICEHRPGRNAKFFFNLNGHKVSFYGYAVNASKMHEYLVENERYDNDTLRAERQAREEEAERERQMQRKAQADDSDWDDDDEGWD